MYTNEKTQPKSIGLAVAQLREIKLSMIETGLELLKEYRPKITEVGLPKEQIELMEDEIKKLKISALEVAIAKLVIPAVAITKFESIEIMFEDHSQAIALETEGQFIKQGYIPYIPVGNPSKQGDQNYALLKKEIGSDMVS